MPRIYRYACWLIACCLLCALANAEPAPDSPVVRRGKELIGMINAGDKAKAEQFIKESYGEEILKMPMDVHLGFLAMMRDQTRGLEFVGSSDVKETEGVVIARSKLTGDEVRLVVRVEPQPPHRITGIGRRAARPGTDNAPGDLSPEAFSKELDAYLTKLAGSELFSGVVLVADGEQPLFCKAYGVANRDFDVPNRTDTKFNLGSMNKMFTAVAVAQLAERGKLSLEDPLSKFAPDYPTTEAAGKIRIKHLLTHTSGLGSFFNSKFRDKSRAALRDIDSMLEVGREDRLAFEPGTKWQYSNTGYLVLGKVIEKASGQSYFDYVRENIFKPAGMIGTDCYDLDQVNPNLAVGYHKQFKADGSYEWKNNLFEHVIRGGPAGGGYSTAEDLQRFALALRSNKLLSEEMTRTVLSPKPELNSPTYGYGFQHFAGSPLVGHGGGFPGISSRLAFFPGKGPIVVVLSNLSDGAMMPVAKVEQLGARLDMGQR